MKTLSREASMRSIKAASHRTFEPSQSRKGDGNDQENSEAQDEYG